MQKRNHHQLRGQLTSWVLGVLFSTLAGCTGLEGLDGPYFGEAVLLVGDGALIGSPGFVFGENPGLAYVFERTSDGWIQRAVLSAEGGKGGNQFGSAVALAETTALVGAWGTDGVAPVSGSAYIFERGPTGWGQTAVLINPDAGERNLLGYSVALDESTAVVGAPGVKRKLWTDTTKTTHTRSGAAYVWSRDETGWRYKVRITPDSLRLAPDSSAQPGPDRMWEDFGRTVALDGDVLVVAAHNETTRPGAVYIFRRIGDAWNQEAKLEQQQDAFGIALTVSDGTVAVASASSVFVFTHIEGDWRLQAKVEPHVAGGEVAELQDGFTVSIDGNLLVVGAVRYQKRKGAAFVFEREGADWKQVAMIAAEDTRSDSFISGRGGDSFGISVAIHSENIVVGASFHDSEGPNHGAAYVFSRDGSEWLQTSKLVAQAPRN